LDYQEAIMPVSRCTATQEEDGWGHALEGKTIKDDLRELKGYLDGTDKHEQVMQKLEEQVRKDKSTNQSNTQ
jgi:hypothetical protein